ncbi:hypothetical protein IAD21_01783 [Abditibacteriota bacterium]|nr:hypothetical protein IAD21_00013 [Abditibacteriota bacterium]BCM89933.1 hypothetical protein IAD21_01783 [Abditibacteriota bacterium]
MFVFDAFSSLPDPRTPFHSFKHSLMELMCIALCALLSGGESFVDMQDYGEAKEHWLRKRLGLELVNGIPSHDTFNRVFATLDPDAFERCFVRWTQQLHQESAGEILAIDGKSVRRSFDSATGQGALHLVSVWASDTRLVLAQRAVEAKSNEMTAVPLLLEMLDIQGAVVTTDALNTQKKVAKAIRERGGEYVLALKENHKHLFEDVRDYFAWCRKQKGGLTLWCQDSAQTREWAHGRQEVRRCFCVAVAPHEWPHAVAQWADLQCVVMIERERTVQVPEGVPHGATVSPEVTQHFYLSSLPPDAPRLLGAIRAHWGIENSLHWVLDVAFDEDDCRVRRDHAAHNLATLRKIALNLLRSDQKLKVGIKARRKVAGWNEDYLLRLLAAP